MEKNNEEKVYLVEKKYRTKIGEYKQKIEQYKAKIMQLINQRPVIDENKDRNTDMRIQDLEKKIVLINREADKKLSELRSQKDKDKV